MSKPRKAKAVILFSGAGSTMENLINRANDGSCMLEVLGVISSKSSATGIARAQALGVPTRVVNRRDFADSVSFSRKIYSLIAGLDEKPDLILLAGFMHYLHVDKRWAGKIMNIHPSLLPKFGGKGMYGEHVHRAVIASGDSESGCTVHYVDDVYDNGPIILQRKVPVGPHDTWMSLRAKVQEAEREAYPAAVNLYAERRLMQVAQSVRILPVKAGAAD